MRKAIIDVIAGPTASGKSAHALALAERRNGVIINADSMQVYDRLRVITARPSPQDEARAPHRLYGTVPASERHSVGDWRAAALAEIAAALSMGRHPILVGGTGFYLASLIAGLSPIPEVPAVIRRTASARRAELGPDAFFAELADRDPVIAARLNPADSQRVLRAWEVFAATGRPLSDWQAEPRQGPPDHLGFAVTLISPPRDILNDRIDARLWQMIALGALEEVRSTADLDADLPAMKALGVPELRAHLRDEMTLDEAVAAARQSTRRFAKRQRTWFRTQMTADRLGPHLHSCHVLDS